MKYSAIVRFINKEEGGRTSPPMSGYKPHIKIGKEHTSCRITAKDSDVETLDFGCDHDVYIEFQFEERFANQIKSGLNIGLYEGNRLVGHGYLIN